MSSVKEFGDVFRQLKADVLISSHPWSAPSMEKKKGQLFIYDAHNCEYRLMRSLIKKHPLGDIVSLWAKRIEHAACKKSDIIIVCSKQEKNEFINLYRVKEKKIHIIPNGATVKPLFSAKEKESAKEKLALGPRKAIVFIGSYYEPNIQAVGFILDKLAADLKEYILLIGGSVKSAFENRAYPENVKFYGMLSEAELDNILKAADIAINPVLIGSGINIKMLDYMSYGLPVVTTECGARGIELCGKKPMIVAARQNFAENICRLVNDESLQAKMSEDARALISEQYSWKKISSKLEQLILQAL
jgi:glycosyltransferase involved in cell wall biosynthesis